MRRRLPLFPALSNNGHLVHLANRFGEPACGADLGAYLRVQGRITCRRCAAREPRCAERHARKPIVVGLNWDAYYDALGRAIRGGATSMPKKLPGPRPIIRKHLPKRWPWVRPNPLARGWA